MGTAVYSDPLLYDVAFGYRDVPAECEFLCEMARTHGCGVGPFLELASGPAAHAREMARRGLRAAALDLSLEMTEYAAAAAAAEGLELRAVAADMRDFDLGEQFHFAATLLDSTAHLTRNEDFVAHLEAVARHLVPGGIHVLEMSHPREQFVAGPKPTSAWTEERDGLRVETAWRQPTDEFDPITQIDRVTVQLRAYGKDGLQGRIDDTVLQRRYTHQTVRALLEQSRVKPLAWYGDLNAQIPFDNRPEAWRMVIVLGRDA